MKNPCYDEQTKTDCPKRCAGCAGSCPEWADYVKVRDAEYQKRKDIGMANSAIKAGRFRVKEYYARLNKLSIRGKR